METENQNNSNSAKEQLKNQISILRSGNSAAIKTTVEEIRKNGQVDIMPEIFELLLNSPNEEISNSCIKLLNDLKLKEAQPFVIDAIKNKKYEAIHPPIVSSCWQSRQDYSEYIQDFIDIFISGSYMVAIEAFTVIENCLIELKDDAILKSLSKLNQSIDKIEDDKKPLHEELIMLIKRF